MRLLVVDMLNVFCLVSSMGFGAYRMGISKTFVFFTCRTLGKLVHGSLQNVFCKLLVLITFNLDKEMGPHLALRPTSLMSVKMFFHFVPVGNTI